MAHRDFELHRIPQLGSAVFQFHARGFIRDIQAQLNVKISGDQKISPFPHWTLSTLTPNKRYSFPFRAGERLVCQRVGRTVAGALASTGGPKQSVDA